MSSIHLYYDKLIITCITLQNLDDKSYDSETNEENSQVSFEIFDELAPINELSLRLNDTTTSKIKGLTVIEEPDPSKFISMSSTFIQKSISSREQMINEYLSYYKSTDATPIEEYIGESQIENYSATYKM